MIYFFSFLSQVWGNCEDYSQVYNLTLGQLDNKFVVKKGLGSEKSLMLVGINRKPCLKFDESADSWKVETEYFDDVGWVQGYSSLKVVVPGTVSGKAYVALYSYSKVPYFTVENSFNSKSSCLFPCKNRGVCIDGFCSCDPNYGGSDCSIFFTTLSIDDTPKFEISSKNWEFFRVKSQTSFKINAKSTSSNNFRLYYSAEKTKNELPTVLNSKEYTFEEGSSKFSHQVDGSSNYYRVSIYCYTKSGDCEGEVNFSRITHVSYLWIIIFSVVFGVFFIGSVPLILIYCKRNSSRTKIGPVQISKQHMERMFPVQEYLNDQSELCTICLEELKGEKLCRELACLHFFHADCIDEWALENLDCPVCKQNLISEFLEAQKQEPNGKDGLLTEN